MNRPWRAGPRGRERSTRFRRAGLIMTVLLLGGLGWLFGGHLVQLAQLSRQASALQSEETGLVRARTQHRQTLERLDDPDFIEELAREQGWGYPDETLVIVEEP